jgi:cysteinyl-tRNA synthetase
MSLKYLGDHFDIHCGGIDHIPVHHTNEIAQNEAAAGHQTVNYWLHGEFLLTNDERMGKSQGNFLTLQLLKDKGFDPLAYRYFCFTAHYRQKLNFTFEALTGAQQALEKLRHQMLTWPEPTEVDTVTIEKFTQAINDDLNMPQVLAIVWTMVRSNMDPSIKHATMLEMDIVLGLHLNQSPISIPAEIMELVMARETAREAKEWKVSDELRDKIAQHGFVVEDTKTGARVFPLIKKT